MSILPRISTWTPIAVLTACMVLPATGRGAGPELLATISAHRSTPEGPPPGWSRLATATVLLAPVYDSLGRPRHVVGSIQRGTVVAARPARSNEPCHDRGEAGSWFEIPGGYVCSASGYAIGDRAARVTPRQRRPDLSKAVPFPFVKVTTDSSIRFDEPLRSKDLIAEYNTVAYFLAKDREFEKDGTRWVKTVYDEYVPASEVRPIVPTSLVGERLDGNAHLPMAFTFGDEDGVPLECDRGGTFTVCGQLPKHARFEVAGPPREGRLRHPSGRWIHTQHVRVIRSTRRPDGVPAQAKWIHVDLEHQAFVAYEGDQPVYASLISTGAKGYETPNGLHRVYRKYVTKTMRGPDADAGRYRVEEIPWVMYYHGNYALHGAYWHNQFGEVRSHGCTNIAPADAKWLYEWGTGTMPPGWHANYRVENGTWVYLTGSERTPT
ncbi:MAG TPA: L,D-transpeptidase [Myxococcales bacterium LLY-WYZ-16_1]|nr:L,D-transpeptidase [Myxococcales bacterium LLY-WYZ-16_1]